MRKGLTLFVLLSLAALLVLALGVSIAGRGETSTGYQRQIETLYLQTATRMHVIKVGLWGGLALVVVLGAAGVAAGLVRLVWLRSQLIPPQSNGLFPVIQGHTCRQTYYHDPNRQLAGSVAYGTGPDGAVARPLQLPDDRGQQLQVTAQAQAAQLVAAAVQGQNLTAQGRRLAERVAQATAPRPTPHLPRVIVPDEIVPEERHLIAALRADWEE